MDSHPPCRYVSPVTGSGGWQGNLFGPPAPICSSCGLRSARRHFAVGFYPTCFPCYRQNSRRHRRRSRSPHPRPCPICGTTTTNPFTCSRACERLHSSLRKDRLKARVFSTLGNACACLGSDCWHPGPCLLTHPDILEVDHIRSDGHLVRRHRLGKRRVAGNAWSRYCRALRLPDHGMQLLCANCHRWVTVQRRRLSSLPAGENESGNK